MPSRFGPLLAALVVTVCATSCTYGFGTAREGDDAGSDAEAGAVSTTAQAGSGTATTGPVPSLPTAASDPAAVPGADRFGVASSDDLCTIATKVGQAFVGLFGASYETDSAGLQRQLEDAIVATEVLRTRATGDLAGHVDRSAAFLYRLRDVLTAAGFDLATAAQRDPGFFQGPETDAGFQAMSSAAQLIQQTCQVTF